jgi:hypothetical protein
LRTIFELRRKEVRGWRKLYNDKLHNLNSSPNTILVFKSHMLRWEGYVSHIEEVRNAYKISIRKPEG